MDKGDKKKGEEWETRRIKKKRKGRKDRKEKAKVIQLRNDGGKMEEGDVSNRGRENKEGRKEKVQEKR